MEAGEIIKFDNEEYKIIKRLYRKNRSVGQNILVEDPSGLDVETRRNFYIVEKDYEQYFVKEYTDINYGGHAEYEYNLMKTLSSYKEVKINGHKINPTKPIAINNEMILMEYNYNYVSLNDVRIDDNVKTIIVKLFLEWVRKNNPVGLQVTRSNFMIKTHCNYIDIKLVDFEYSEGHDEKEWFKFLTDFLLEGY